MLSKTSRAVLKGIAAIALVLSFAVPAQSVVLAGEAHKTCPEGATAGKFSTIACTYNRGYAIGRDGWLYGWGEEGGSTPIGDGTIDGSPVPKKILEDVVSIRTTDSYTYVFALKSNGDVYAWGYFGGSGGTIATPTKILSGASAICTEGGVNRIYVIMANGDLNEFDYGSAGSARIDTPPVKVFSDVKSVKINQVQQDFVELEILATTKDGKAYSWEVVWDANYEKLTENKPSLKSGDEAAKIVAELESGNKWIKDGVFEINTTMDKVPKLTNVAFVTDSGYNDYLALKNDGTVWVKGRCGGVQSSENSTGQKENGWVKVMADVRLPGEAAKTAAPVTALPSAQKVTVNGKLVDFDAYNIGGNNYFKLRDIAFQLNGTSATFDVRYDTAAKAIAISTGKAYTPDGNEMAKRDGVKKTAEPSAQKVIIDGKEVSLSVYIIGGSSYFKVAELSVALGFSATYDNASATVKITTK